MRHRLNRSVLGTLVLGLLSVVPIGIFTLPGNGSILAGYTAEPMTTQISIVLGAGSNTALAGYSPVNAVVVVGVNNTVRWTNNDNALHTATSTSGAISSGDIQPGQSYTVTLSTPGTYSYGCVYHSWMHGSIVVKSTPVPEFPFPGFVLLAVVFLAAVALRLVGKGRTTQLGGAKGAQPDSSSLSLV